MYSTVAIPDVQNRIVIDKTKCGTIEENHHLQGHPELRAGTDGRVYGLVIGGRCTREPAGLAKDGGGNTGGSELPWKEGCASCPIEGSNWIQACC